MGCGTNSKKKKEPIVANRKDKNSQQGVKVSKFCFKKVDDNKAQVEIYNPEEAAKLWDAKLQKDQQKGMSKEALREYKEKEIKMKKAEEYAKKYGMNNLHVYRI
jgi:hypothetical protein